MTSFSGSVLHTFVACGTNEPWKVFVQAKGWCRRNHQSVCFEDLSKVLFIELVYYGLI